MIDFQLFLGIAIEGRYAEALEGANPYMLESFINNSSDYLHEIEADGTKYLGKRTDNGQSVSDLEMLEANIYSLLSRLTKDVNFKEKPLVLFAVQRDE